MFCPACYGRELRVLDSRPIYEQNQIRRRRQCCLCHYRFSTMELIETGFPKVVKNQGHIEEFDIGKIRNGILKAIEKRSLSVSQVDQIVGRIVHRVKGLQVKQLPSKEIGCMIIEELKDVDVIAMIRFAAVYHAFLDAESFKQFVDDVWLNLDSGVNISE